MMRLAGPLDHLHSLRFADGRLNTLFYFERITFEHPLEFGSLIQRDADGH